DKSVVGLQANEQNIEGVCRLTAEAPGRCPASFEWHRKQNGLGVCNLHRDYPVYFAIGLGAWFFDPFAIGRRRPGYRAYGSPVQRLRGRRNGNIVGHPAGRHPERRNPVRRPDEWRCGGRIRTSLNLTGLLRAVRSFCRVDPLGNRTSPCPLLGVKRTSVGGASMSA